MSLFISKNKMRLFYTRIVMTTITDHSVDADLVKNECDGVDESEEGGGKDGAWEKDSHTLTHRPHLLD